LSIAHVKGVRRGKKSWESIKAKARRTSSRTSVPRDRPMLIVQEV